MKKVLTMLLVTITIVINAVACGGGSSKNIEKFHDLIVESQELLDIVADDIYDNWHGAIYDDEYGGDIDMAILYALGDNSENIEVIKANNDKIKDLYKKAKGSDLELEVKDVMHAYNDYYALVIEVSGSFATFKESKETLKKELASAIKNLEMEM